MKALLMIAWALAGPADLPGPDAMPTVEAVVPCDPKGRTILDLGYDRDGKVLDVRVIGSSGDAALDRAAAKAARSWKVNPATRGGRAVAGRAQVPVDYPASTKRSAEPACAPAKGRARAR